MKRYLYIVIAIVAVVLSSCGSDSFKIEGRIDGLGSQNVQVMYATTEGVESAWITANEGMLNYEGYAPELTVLTVADSRGEVLCRLAVKNGDKIKFRGPVGDPYGFQCKGSKVTKQWNEFIQSHLQEYGQQNGPMIDIAIEKYIRENPKNILSTILLLYDYSDVRNHDAIDKLFALIDEKAKPGYMMATYEALRRAKEKGMGERYFFQVVLYDSNGEWTPFNAREHGMNVLWLWSTSDDDHRQQADSLKTMLSEYGKRMRVADVLLDGDTVMWRSTFKSDSTKWNHYWAPGGPETPVLEQLKTYSTPTYVLIDSFGAFKYQGNSIKELKKLLNKSKKK